ncbi:hypothetical protein CR513_47920, partial [Mucuna pruriens]
MNTIYSYFPQMNKKFSHIKGGAPPRDDPKFEMQGILLVTKYYRTLNELWIKLVERGRIFKFLYGLNSKYDPIQVQIIGKKNIHSLFEIFSIVQDEET